MSYLYSKFMFRSSYGYIHLFLLWTCMSFFRGLKVKILLLFANFLIWLYAFLFPLLSLCIEIFFVWELLFINILMKSVSIVKSELLSIFMATEFEFLSMTSIFMMLESNSKNWMY